MWLQEKTVVWIGYEKVHSYKNKGSKSTFSPEQLSLIFNKKFFKREKNLNVALNRKQDCLLPFLTTSRKVSEEVKLEMIVKVFYSPVEFTLKDDWLNWADTKKKTSVLVCFLSLDRVSSLQKTKASEILPDFI